MRGARAAARDEGERFVGDLLDIGVDERSGSPARAARRCLARCSTRRARGLPIDVAPFGIERFDVNRDDWRSQFRAWLDAVRTARGRGRAVTAAAVRSRSRCPRGPIPACGRSRRTNGRSSSAASG